MSEKSIPTAGPVSSVVITVPRGARVLLLEDSPERIAWFRERIPNLRVVSSVSEAQIALLGHTYDVVFLDHDLEVSTWQPTDGSFDCGYTVAKSLAEQGYIGDQVVIHSWNPAGAERMAACFEAGALVIPFGRFELRCGSS